MKTANTFKSIFIVLCTLFVFVITCCTNLMLAQDKLKSMAGYEMYNEMAPKIKVTHAATWTLDLNGEITEAGTDFIGTYTSPSDQGKIKVYGSVGSSLWTVSVSYQANIDWDSSISILVRRTGDGTIQGNSNNAFISGGTTYQQVGLIDQTFFEGRRKRRFIPIQYQLNNISVTIPAQLYNATIYYTLTTQ